jgi:hypothetical protein
METTTGIVTGTNMPNNMPLNLALALQGFKGEGTLN